MNKQLTRQVLDEIGRQNMTITELSKRLKVSKQYTSKLLNEGMSMDYFVKICEALNMKIVLIPAKYLTIL